MFLAAWTKMTMRPFFKNCENQIHFFAFYFLNFYFREVQIIITSEIRFLFLQKHYDIIRYIIEVLLHA